MFIWNIPFFQFKWHPWELASWSSVHRLKGAQSNGLKRLAWIFQFRCNPCQSTPSLTTLVPLWFIIISLAFFYLCKVLFSGFLQYKGNFVDAQNDSKYRDCAPLTLQRVFLDQKIHCELWKWSIFPKDTIVRWRGRNITMTKQLESMKCFQTSGWQSRSLFPSSIFLSAVP